MDAPYKLEPPPRQTANDYQVGGTHYTKMKVQPWDYMAATMTHEAFAGFLVGNVIKYVSRYLEKDGVKDLQKAKHYLEKLIEMEVGQ